MAYIAHPPPHDPHPQNLVVDGILQGEFRLAPRPRVYMMRRELTSVLEAIFFYFNLRALRLAPSGGGARTGRRGRKHPAPACRAGGDRERASACAFARSRFQGSFGASRSTKLYQDVAVNGAFLGASKMIVSGTSSPVS